MLLLPWVCLSAYLLVCLCVFAYFTRGSLSKAPFCDSSFRSQSEEEGQERWVRKGFGREKEDRTAIAVGGRSCNRSVVQVQKGSRGQSQEKHRNVQGGPVARLSRQATQDGKVQRWA